ncbi:MAG: ABC transporter permease [Elusimicrobia bacterium]|nr:ABC transporter permease [Elusimicrobiota bacterium]
MRRRPGFRAQLDVLIDRVLAVHMGSAGTMLLLAAQAPAIGACVGLAWRAASPTASAHFVMSVAAVWMGCMNACTAIVQERAVFDRERMFDLDIRAYLLSKLAVLATLGAVQAALLLASAGALMHLPASPRALALEFLALTATSAAAAALGLCISAFAKSAQGAVVIVPILLIPQVVFSKLILREAIERDVPKWLHRLTLTKWCFEALENAPNDVKWLDQMGAWAALAAWTAVFFSVAAFKLRLDDS